MSKDTDSIVFGVVTGIALLGVYLIGTEIYERLKPKPKEQQR